MIKDLCPPFLWRLIKHGKRFILKHRAKYGSKEEGKQELAPYWDEKMALLLEVWGEGTVWNEIPMFLFGCSGKVLDIACGTGKAMSMIQKVNPDLDVYGCDISEMLIDKAKARGLQANKFYVCNATDMSEFKRDFFDYSYSIGSLEHFTLEGIGQFIAETHRIVRKASFHMVPVSRSGRNEGWIKTTQTYYNNSEDWWLGLFRQKFEKVLVFHSKWEDELSFGKWFVAIK